MGDRLLAEEGVEEDRDGKRCKNPPLPDECGLREVLDDAVLRRSDCGEQLDESLFKEFQQS
jgi:hypothetical protein